MKILTDIVHSADVNFYKRAVEELRKEHEVAVNMSITYI